MEEMIIEKEQTVGTFPNMAFFAAYCKQSMKIQDENDNEWNSLDEFWKHVKDRKAAEKNLGTKKEWYDLGEEYWDKQPTTVDGVLGGYGKYHEFEAKSSEKIMDPFLEYLPSRGTALEAGGGIGRISKRILHKQGFQHIDLQDQSNK